MISVGNRDGKKDLRLGFGGIRGMEESELEEGEAFGCHDNSTSIDLDSLSYLDEKVQDVLGHFQKDFEGGVSAENLGAKYGGYGSFLPTYQRSPTILPHPRTPQKVPNPPKSPNPHPIEGTQQNFSAAASGSLYTRQTPISSGEQPCSTRPNVGNVLQSNTRVISKQSAGDINSKSDSLAKTTNTKDQKSLKVRIKVGTDDASTRKSAEIYSGLGLDVSPSTSLDESPYDSGLSPENHYSPIKSSYAILKMFTSFPDTTWRLLSPLSDVFYNLEKKEMPSLKSNDDWIPVKGNQTSSTINEKNFMERNGKSTTKKIASIKDENFVATFSPKQVDVNSSAFIGITSNASNLSLHMNLKDPDAKDRGQAIASKKKVGSVKAKIPSGLGVEEPAVSLEEKMNTKVFSDERVGGEKNTSNQQDPSFLFSLKDTQNKSGKVSGSHVSEKKDIIISETSRDSQKSSFNAEDGYKPPRKEKHSGTKKKIKGVIASSPSNIEYPSKISAVNVSSALLKERKKSNHSMKYSEERNGSLKSCQESPKTNFKNHLNTEFSSKTVSSQEEHSKEKVSQSEFEDVHRLTEKSKEDLCVKKIEKHFHEDGLTVNGPTVDVAVAPSDPIVIQENWVCCDKCQKWRLLPFGKNPDILPKKWLCSMLDWLRPGMNRCNISEEETTKALNALYHVHIPVPEGLNSQPIVDGHQVVPHVDEKTKFVSHSGSNVGRKKQGLKDSGHTFSYPNPSLVSNSMKKQQQSSAKSTDVDHNNPFSLESNGVDLSFIVEKGKNKHKERHKDVNHICNEGGKPIKCKIKREDDSFVTSKKTKVEDFCYADGDWDTDIPPQSHVKESQKQRDTSTFKVSKSNNNEYTFGKKSKDHFQISSADGEPQIKSSDASKYSKTNIAVKKRRRNEGEVNQDGDNCLNRRDGEKVDAIDYRKEKKGKVSKTKEFNSSKADGREVKKSKVNRLEEEIITSNEKETNLAQFDTNQIPQYPYDSTNQLKRDLTCTQHSVAATSSSSKVSSTCKSKSSIREVKGSPVESVSSSPWRISSIEITTSSRKEMPRKGDPPGLNVSKCGIMQDNGVTGKSEHQVDNLDHSVGSSQKKSSKSSSLSKSRNTKPKSDTNKIKKVKVSTNSFRGTDGSHPKKSSDSWQKAHACDRSSQDEITQKYSSEKRVFDRDDRDQSLKKEDASVRHKIVDIDTKSSNKMTLNGSEVMETASGVSNELFHCSSTAPSQQKVTKPSTLPVDIVNLDASKQRLSDKQSGANHTSARQPTPNAYTGKVVDAPSPAKKDANHLGSLKLKEARDLKHTADRLKNSGIDLESTTLHFMAALKFLHAALLLEPMSTEGFKHGEPTQSLKVYTDTADLCLFCARGYERNREMASAALAYKSMELAFMRVVFLKHSSANKDRLELQSSLQMVPPGESPSSSASDVDNLNHQSVDKISLSKGVNSLGASNQIIAPRNRHNFVRMLNFVHEVNSAMDALRKSQSAFLAASGCDDEVRLKPEVLSSVKQALDYSFHDVEGLLQLLRVAVETIYH